jgi:hypothetical protein
LIDDLAHHVQVRRLQVEHLTADERGRLGERFIASARNTESGSMRMSSSMNRICSQSVFSAPRTSPGCSAGAAEVGLIVDREPVTQRGGAA